MSELSPETQELLRRGRAGIGLSPSRRARLRAAVLTHVAATAVAPAVAAGAGSAGAAGAVSAAGAAGASAWTSFFTAVLIGMGGTAVAAGIVRWGTAPSAAPTGHAPALMVSARPAVSKPRTPGASSASPTAILPSVSSQKPQRTMSVPETREPNERVPSSLAVGAREPDACKHIAPAVTAPEPDANKSAWPRMPEATKQTSGNLSQPVQGLSPEPTGSVRVPGAALRPMSEALKEEARLLTAAHAALGGGNPGEALRILDQCAAQFPQGALAPERAAEHIFALCRAARTQEARTEAAGFLRTHPAGPLASRVRSSCGGTGI